MSKIVAKQAFTTSDGQNFFDMSEAQTHQAKLDNANVIEAFLAKANTGKAQAGMLRNTLPAFIAFKAEVDATGETPNAATGDAGASGEATGEATGQ